MEPVGSFQKYFDCAFVVISHNNFVNVTKSAALKYVKHVRIDERTMRFVYNEQWAAFRAARANV